AIGLAQACQIVIRRLFYRRVEVFPDVDPQNTFVTHRLHVCDKTLYTVIIEAHAVDNGIGLRQAKQSGLRISRLWPGRDRANFDKSESKSCQRVYMFAVLVQSRCQSDRLGKSQPHYAVG